MITIKRLKELLNRIPNENARLHVYEGEVTGIVIRDGGGKGDGNFFIGATENKDDDSFIEGFEEEDKS